MLHYLVLNHNVTIKHTAYTTVETLKFVVFALSCAWLLAELRLVACSEGSYSMYKRIFGFQHVHACRYISMLNDICKPRHSQPKLYSAAETL